MSTHFRRLTLLLLLCSAGVSAQVDTLRALSFFPLHIGDRWQYAERYIIDTTVIDTYRTVTVLGDTLMPNNKTYRVLENGPGYFRIDSSALKVYQYFPDSFQGNCPDSEVVYYDLVYPDSGLFHTCAAYAVQVDSGRGRIGQLPDSADFLNFNWFDGLTHYVTLSAGIGQSLRDEGELFDVRDELIAATIDGVQYGQYVLGVEPGSGAPQGFHLDQNYPNPFNPSTTVEFGIANAQWVTLKIYDALGREVKTLVNGRLAAGSQSVQWDGSNAAGQPVASGVYFYRLTVLPPLSPRMRGDERGVSQARKMLLLR